MAESFDSLIIEELNLCDFFERETLYAGFPLWYYAKFEIEEKYRKKDLKYLILAVDEDINLNWLVSNRKNGEQFKIHHELNRVSGEYALDVLAVDEDAFSQLIELISLLFSSKENND